MVSTSFLYSFHLLPCSGFVNKDWFKREFCWRIRNTNSNNQVQTPDSNSHSLPSFRSLLFRCEISHPKNFRHPQFSIHFQRNGSNQTISRKVNYRRYEIGTGKPFIASTQSVSTFQLIQCRWSEPFDASIVEQVYNGELLPSSFSLNKVVRLEFRWS
jgi:hypothetical protein